MAMVMREHAPRLKTDSNESTHKAATRHWYKDYWVSIVIASASGQELTCLPLDTRLLRENNLQ